MQPACNGVYSKTKHCCGRGGAIDSITKQNDGFVRLSTLLAVLKAVKLNTRCTLMDPFQSRQPDWL